MVSIVLLAVSGDIWELKVLYKRWRKLSFEDEPALY